MKVIRLFVWMVGGIVAMLFTLYHYFRSDWQQATFWLAAIILADMNFYRAYDEIVADYKQSGTKPPPLPEKVL